MFFLLSNFRALVAASPRSMTRSQLFWHSLSYIRRFSPLRMTKRGDVRRPYEMTLFPYRQPSPLGEGAPQGRIGHRRYERQMRKAEQRGICGEARVPDREWQRLNQCFLKIIRAPSSGRGRRAKRGGVGFPECGSTVTRGQPPPIRGTSFQRKEGEKRAHLCC